MGKFGRTHELSSYAGEGEAIAAEHGPKVSAALDQMYDLTDGELDEAITFAKMSGRPQAYMELVTFRDSRQVQAIKGEN